MLWFFSVAYVDTVITNTGHISNPAKQQRVIGYSVVWLNCLELPYTVSETVCF